MPSSRSLKKDEQAISLLFLLHHLTVMWNPDKPEEAAKKLKATIRATLPEVAKMDD